MSSEATAAETPDRSLVDVQPTVRACPICGHTRQLHYRVQVNRGKEGMTLVGEHNLYVCQMCFFLQNPSNCEKGLNEVDRTSSRVGREDKPGREFIFASKAVKCFQGRAELDVLVYGAGVSLDYLHIRKLPVVANTVVADIGNHMGAEDFIDIRTSSANSRKFDIVIASEVAEHFEEPIAHFESLLNFVADDGICVVGTNFVGGMPLSRLIYPYTEGHVCMWSESSIQIVSEKFGFYAVTFLSRIGGDRKRIIIMTKSKDLYLRLLVYFERKKYFV